MNVVVETCFKATHSWDAKRKRWNPGEAQAALGLVRVSAEFCHEATKSPPWLQLSGLMAAPAVLLTWYWRDKKRRADERTAYNAHQLATQVAFSERYTKAAELLASSDAMTRINGLESLWDIAVQSQEHRAAVSRTLAAFVRNRAPTVEVPQMGPIGRAALERILINGAVATDVQTSMTLLGRPEWGEHEWPRERSEIDLRAAALRAARLRSAEMSRADFESANLEDADLTDANLVWAKLHFARLAGTRLIGAKLADAELMAADLTEAILRGADLARANLTKANLRRANLEDANLPGAILANACLEGAHLDKAKLRLATLISADLQGASLCLADLRDANLTRANLTKADLEGATLDGAYLDCADLTDANLCHAKLEHAFLHQGNVGSANPEGAGPAGHAELKGALYNNYTTLPAGFDPKQHGMIKADPTPSDSDQLSDSPT